MRRLISSFRSCEPAALEKLPAIPPYVCLSIEPSALRCSAVPSVKTGQNVEAGTVIAAGDAISVHAPLKGQVESVDARAVTIRSGVQNEPAFAVPSKPAAADLPAFAASMGLAGMGGSMFPASIKLKAAAGIHTLIINTVECEPGIEIDDALITLETDTMAAGIGLIAEALNPKHIVIAAKYSASKRMTSLKIPAVTRILAMPDTYPAGAERLIVQKLSGRFCPASVLPAKLGYLVFSAASLWAIGRRIGEGRPSIDRPLTLNTSISAPRNLVVPLGTPISHILSSLSVPFDAENEILIAGGLMMGRRVTPETPVTQGTNAIFIRPITSRMLKKEQPCIMCGSCHDACPLGLHPSGMADRIRSGAYPQNLRPHIQECFLCGACSAVCPAEIPLVQYFLEGKAWLRKQ